MAVQWWKVHNLAMGKLVLLGSHRYRLGERSVREEEKNEVRNELG